MLGVAACAVDIVGGVAPRVLVGKVVMVVLVVVVLASLFTYKWLFGVVVILALGVAMREMIQAFASRGIKIARVPAYGAVVLLPTVAYVAGPLSVADFAILGWAWRHERHQVDLADYPQVRRWYDRMMARPAVQRGFAVALS